MAKKLALMGHILLILFCFTACKSVQPTSYSTFESRVIDKEDKGFYIIRAQGKGTTMDKATEAARRQAVQDVLFKNMHSTYGDHEMLRAVVSDPLQIEKRTNFFNNFFDEKKNYGKYIGKCADKKEEYKADNSYNVIMNVAVNRKALLDYMKENDVPTNR